MNMKMKNFQFSKYCSPAQLYLVLGTIGIIGAFFNNYSIETLLTKALFLVIWAWVLNWLCSKGFKAISWILVLLPFIMALFTYFFIKDVVKVKEGARLSDDPKKRAGEIADAKAANAAVTNSMNKNPTIHVNTPAADNSMSPTANTLNNIAETGLSYLGG